MKAVARHARCVAARPQRSGADERDDGEAGQVGQPAPLEATRRGAEAIIATRRRRRRRERVPAAPSRSRSRSSSDRAGRPGSRRSATVRAGQGASSTTTSDTGCHRRVAEDHRSRRSCPRGRAPPTPQKARRVSFESSIRPVVLNGRQDVGLRGMRLSSGARPSRSARPRPGRRHRVGSARPTASPCRDWRQPLRASRATRAEQARSRRWRRGRRSKNAVLRRAQRDEHTPPSARPIARLTAPSASTAPISRPCRCSGVSRCTMLISAGHCMPLPMPPTRPAAHACAERVRHRQAEVSALRSAAFRRRGARRSGLPTETREARGFRVLPQPHIASTRPRPPSSGIERALHERDLDRRAGLDEDHRRAARRAAAAQPRDLGDVTPRRR